MPFIHIPRPMIRFSPKPTIKPPAAVKSAAPAKPIKHTRQEPSKHLVQANAAVSWWLMMRPKTTAEVGVASPPNSAGVPNASAGDFVMIVLAASFLLVCAIIALSK